MRYNFKVFLYLSRSPVAPTFSSKLYIRRGRLESQARQVAFSWVLTAIWPQFLAPDIALELFFAGLMLVQAALQDEPRRSR